MVPNARIDIWASVKKLACIHPLKKNRAHLWFKFILRTTFKWYFKLVFVFCKPEWRGWSKGTETTFSCFRIEEKIGIYVKRLRGKLFDRELCSKVLKEDFLLFLFLAWKHEWNIQIFSKWNKKCYRTKFVPNRTKNVPHMHHGGWNWD